MTGRKLTRRRLRRARGAWGFGGALVLTIAGCGGGAKGTGTTDYVTIRAMGDMYGLYQSEHGGAAPKDEQAFREFLASKQEALDRLKLTVDGMFVSPRNGEPLVWAYGKRPPTGPGGAYFAVEKNPTDGTRMAIGARGMHEEIDETQFKKLFPDLK